MTRPAPAQLDALLSQTPVVHDFPLGQSAESRAAQLGALSPADREGLLRALLLLLEEEGWTSSAVPRDPVLLMATEDTEVAEEDAYRGISEDWRLRVFRAADGGVLYDFNGWPGDNEAGRALYFAHPGDTHPVLVFANSDESLTACDPIYADAVAAYAARREDANLESD